MSIPQDANGQAQGAIGLGLNKLVVRGCKPRAAAWDSNGGKLAWSGDKEPQYYARRCHVI